MSTGQQTEDLESILSKQAKTNKNCNSADHMINESQANKAMNQHDELTEHFWKPIESVLEDFQQSNKTVSGIENKLMFKRDPETLASIYRIMSGEITLVITPHNTSLQDVKQMMKFYAHISVSLNNGNKSKSGKLYTASERDAMNSLFQHLEAVYNMDQY